VERAQVPRGLLDEAPGLRLARDVADERQEPGVRHRAPDPLGRPGDGLPVGVEERHRGTLLREEPAGGLADAATAARDERDAAGHAPGHAPAQASVS
jgi:hypothetical protein